MGQGKPQGTPLGTLDGGPLDSVGNNRRGVNHILNLFSDKRRRGHALDRRRHVHDRHWQRLLRRQRRRQRQGRRRQQEMHDLLRLRHVYWQGYVFKIPLPRFGQMRILRGRNYGHGAERNNMLSLPRARRMQILQGHGEMRRLPRHRHKVRHKTLILTT